MDDVIQTAKKFGLSMAGICFSLLVMRFNRYMFPCLPLAFSLGCIEAPRHDVVPSPTCQCCSACPCRVGPSPVVPPAPPQPVVTGKIRVLVVYDVLDRTLPVSKQVAFSNVVTSPEVRSYLEAKCERESSGAAAFRIAPPNTDWSRDDPFWQSAASMRPDGISVPYVVVFRDGKGVASPLPEKPQELLELLRKYGGQ